MTHDARFDWVDRRESFRTVLQSSVRTEDSSVLFTKSTHAMCFVGIRVLSIGDTITPAFRLFVSGAVDPGTTFLQGDEITETGDYVYVLGHKEDNPLDGATVSGEMMSMAPGMDATFTATISKTDIFEAIGIAGNSRLPLPAAFDLNIVHAGPSPTEYSVLVSFIGLER